MAPRGAATTIAIVPPPDQSKIGVETGIAFETHDVEASYATLKAAGVDVDAEISRMGDPGPADVLLPRSGRQYAAGRRSLLTAAPNATPIFAPEV